MSLKRNFRSLGLDPSPKNGLGGEELTAVYLKQRRSVLEKALHEESPFPRLEEISKPEAYVVENNDKLTIQCHFCGNHMAMATLPPPFQLFLPSEGREAKSVESRDAAVQVDLPPTTMLLSKTSNKGHDSADASAGRSPHGNTTTGYTTAGTATEWYGTVGCPTPGYPMAECPAAFLMDPSPSSHSSPPRWNTSAGAPVGTGVSQWRTSSLNESVTKRQQEAELPPVDPVRSTTPICISSSSSSACSSPSSSPCPRPLSSSTFLPVTSLPSLHTTLTQTKNAPTPPKSTPPQPRTGLQSPGPPTLSPQSCTSLGLRAPPSPMFPSPPGISSLDLEEVEDLPPPGLIAPLSPRLAEEEENEEESRAKEAVAGVTKGPPYECSVCHRDMKTKQRLRVHFRVHTGERPFRCELCSCAYAQVGNLQSHMKRKHPLAAPEPSGGRVPRKSSKKVAMAVGGSPSPPKAADVNAPVGFQGAKTLSNSRTASDAPAESRLVASENLDIDRTAGIEGTNVATIANDVVGHKPSSFPTDFAWSRDFSAWDVHNATEVNPIMEVDDAKGKGLEEALGLGCPPGLIAPLSPQLAEEEAVEKESRGNEEIAGATPAPPFECSVCHVDMKTEQHLQIHSKVHTGYWCELCRISYKSVKTLRYHMKRKHPLAIPGPSGGCVPCKSSKKVAMAVGCASSPPKAAEVNASVGFQGVNKALTDSWKASDAPADSKLAGNDNIHIDSTAIIGETSVANIANDVVGHEPSSFPTDLALSRDLSAGEVHNAMELNVVIEVNPIPEVKPNMEVKPNVEVKPIPAGATTGPPFECSICRKDMKTNQHLQIHLRVHTRRYRCELCGTAYMMEESLKNHWRLKHPLSSFHVLGQSSKKVAMAAGAISRPPTAADASVGFQEPTNSGEANVSNIDSTASSGEANVSNIANGKEASKAPTYFKQAGYDIGIDSVVEEVNDIMEVNPITEVNDLKGQFKDITEVNDVSEPNDVKEAAYDVKKKVNGVMELNDANAVVGSAISVLTRRSRRNHPEQRKDFFCFECLECFRVEEDLMKHEHEKHPHLDQPESNDDNSRSPEPFVHQLRWSSEENLLALSTDSEPMTSAEVRTKQSLQQSRKRKASSHRLAEIPAERATGKREKYLTCAQSRHCKTARQNSTGRTDTPGRQTRTPDTLARQIDQPDRQMDTPNRQTDKRAKRTCTLTDYQGRQTNALQPVNEYPFGVEASREERHAGPERQETGSMSEAPERVNMLDGNMPGFLKPCSVRLFRLLQHSLEAHRIKGLEGTSF